MISLGRFHHIIAVICHGLDFFLHTTFVILLLIRKVHREANILHHLHNWPLFCQHRLPHRLLKHQPRQLLIHNGQERAYRRHHVVVRLETRHAVRGEEDAQQLLQPHGTSHLLDHLSAISVYVILLLQIVGDRGYEGRIEVDEDEVRDEGGIAQPASEQELGRDFGRDDDDARFGVSEHFQQHGLEGHRRRHLRRSVVVVFAILRVLRGCQKHLLVNERQIAQRQCRLRPHLHPFLHAARNRHQQRLELLHHLFRARQ
mmetsp:Transcript_30432/g.63635  ORF Transcript_30432/g.63635 Transcript_30432/m.63635 type:complete len:258 (+) Transcript_30432:452-1225(+)